MNVAHVPSTHPYVQTVDPVATRRDDDWSIDPIDESQAQIVHVHFGFEHLSPTDFASWIRAVRDRGLQLVHTVHDIDNPHLVDQTDHHERVGLLVRHSDAVTTLTDAAADLVHRRWNRLPVVIPHPPLARARPIGEKRGTRPLLWLGTVRPNVDLELVQSIVAEPRASVDVVIRTQGWERLPEEVRASLLDGEADRRIALSIIDRPSDAELERIIASAGSLMLPYSWGTHSGLVELASALDVRTVVPAVGCHEGQGALTASRNEMLRLAASVARRGSQQAPLAAASVESIRDAHRTVYESAASSLVSGS